MKTLDKELLFSTNWYTKTLGLPMINETIRCTSCNCPGNGVCGATPAGYDRCALDEDGVCGCCNKLGLIGNIKRWRIK